jgi:hypothetical protein
MRGNIRNKDIKLVATVLSLSLSLSLSPMALQPRLGLGLL